jgi:hypothetical protein
MGIESNREGDMGMCDCTIQAGLHGNACALCTDLRPDGGEVGVNQNRSVIPW